MLKENVPVVGTRRVAAVEAAMVASEAAEGAKRLPENMHEKHGGLRSGGAVHRNEHRRRHAMITKALHRGWGHIVTPARAGQVDTERRNGRLGHRRQWHRTLSFR